METSSSPYSTAKALGNKSMINPYSTMLDIIMDNVLYLEEKLEEFRGVKESKEYKFLEVQFTRKLSALDGIDARGREDIKQKRKESINTINRYLGILETKGKTFPLPNEENHVTRPVQQNRLWSFMKKIFTPCCTV